MNADCTQVSLGRMDRTCKPFSAVGLGHMSKIATRTEFLMAKGYEVHGIIRRSSSFNTGRLHHLYEDQHESMSLIENIPQ